MYDQVMRWAAAHPVLWPVLLAVGFFTLTGVANWLTYPDDPREWRRIQREEPRRAGVVMILRGWGLYPSKTLRGLVAVVTGKLILPPEKK